MNMCTRILLVHNQLTSFVKIDLELLRQGWQVEEWYQARPAVNPVAMVQAIRRSDLVLCWFASWHSLVPVLLARWLGKPALVIIGGYDTANLPEAGYGLQRGGLRRWLARTVINQATHLITNSYSARQEAITNAGADPAKITVIYHGLPLVVAEAGPAERPGLALTVGDVWRENLLRKGLLPFVQAAAYLPQVQFIHAGPWHDDSINVLRQHAAGNVEFKGYVSDQELTALYRSASVYVQASLHEGFGLSLAEAMWEGCIPVVTRAGALPEVVGETGVYARSNAPDAVAAAVEQALLLNGSHRDQVRRRIQTHFTLSQRQQAFQDLLGRWI